MDMRAQNDNIKQQHTHPSYLFYCELKIELELHVNVAATDEMFVSNLPKFTADPILKLSDIVTIIMPNNRLLSDQLKKVVEAEAIDQQSLKSLKQFPSVYQLLQLVLQQSYEEFLYALWTYRLPSGISLTERQLTCIVQFVLTNYANQITCPKASVHFGLTTWLRCCKHLVIIPATLALNGVRR
ncbi:hypothetical protein RMATCC62417_06646 [Rhizopus microsporus]|nr:hypothetical protein RMATCC62417_06646 [Rhizopus microsporus]